jgi:hypothetical protein
MWRFVRSLFQFPFYRHMPVKPEDVHEPPVEFSRESPPDWFLKWTGHLLPHGSGFRGHVGLWESDLKGIGQGEYPVSRSRPSSPKDLFLEAAIVALLLELLRQSFPDRLVSVPAGVIDGIPFELAVHRRQPYRGIRTCCNLSEGLEPVSSQLAGKPLPAVFLLGVPLLEATIALKEA